MRYKANGGSLEDAETGAQILVMLPTNCSKKRLREIVKITANVLNGIEQGKAAARLAVEKRRVWGEPLKYKIVNGEAVCDCPPKCEDCERRFRCLDAGPHNSIVRYRK